MTCKTHIVNETGNCYHCDQKVDDPLCYICGERDPTVTMRHSKLSERDLLTCLECKDREQERYDHAMMEINNKREGVVDRHTADIDELRSLVRDQAKQIDHLVKENIRSYQRHNDTEEEIHILKATILLLRQSNEKGHDYFDRRLESLETRHE